MQNGSCFNLNATVCPTNATNKNVSWSSSNQSVATVSGGTVYANASGYATITATATDGSEASDSCYVSVTGNTLVNSVTVSPSSKTMTVGGSAYLYETVCSTNATNKCVIWSSSNTSVATVNPNSGFVYAQNPGIATIFATAQDGSGKRGSCTVTVTAPVSVESIVLCSTNVTMRVGEYNNLCATVYPLNATNKSVVWSSSNPCVVYVNSNTGFIEAINTGNAVITARTIDGNFIAYCHINVYIKKAVIIVPGVMGTKLVMNSAQNGLSKGAQVWPPIEGGEDFTDVSVLSTTLTKLTSIQCDTNGNSIYDLCVKISDNYGAFDSYKYLYNALENEYSSDRDVVFFGYDWRNTNAYTGNLLSAKVNEYDSVIIVAHSMGGLVTSHMLKNVSTRQKVEKVITLGTPYLGSLEMLPVMSHGHFGYIDTVLEDLPNVLASIAKEVVLQPTLQAMAVNIPSLYELLPTKKFFSLDSRHYYAIQYLFTGTETYESFISTRSWLPLARDNNAIGQFNMTLFDNATAIHDSLWNSNSHITSTVDNYYIAGEGKESMRTYTFKDGFSDSYETTSVTSGDGTVLCYSATMNDLYANKTYFTSLNHNDLVCGNSSARILDFIINIINGNSMLTTGVSSCPSIDI